MRPAGQMAPPSLSSSMGAAGPLLDPGSPPLALLLRYLPVLLSLAAHLPGFLVGFILTWVFFLGFIGGDALKSEYAPVSGFHLVALILLRELFVPWCNGRERAVSVRRRIAKQMTFTRDVQMQWQETLD